jgi:hypothetical protein
MQLIKRYWNEKPLTSILWLALGVRLISVLFSKGYGMHDDHFLIIEASKSWVDGFNFDHWLPDPHLSNQKPSGHSFFYVGLHYLFFQFLKFIHITDPQSQMYLVRLLHALLSLVTVYCGYKIAEKTAGEKQAKAVGILLAIYWMMPFLSVRNLVEVVCVAPLMAATWIVIKNEDNQRYSPFIWAGILLSLAFSIRFQTIFFTGGFGLALLFTNRIREAFITGIFFILVAILIQGGIDLYNWGRPFAEFQEYIHYNLENATAYFTQSWYLYLLTITGVLLPPVSLFFWFGYFRNWRKNLLLFLPAFVFLCFHSYFPNKQERFIFPFIPFLITLGYIGWTEFVSASRFWNQRTSLLKACWIFFWTINILALSVISFAYTKRSRVEAMTYLSKKNDVENIIIEESNRNDIQKPPLFYLNKWVSVYGITNECTPALFYEEFLELPNDKKPNYIIFIQQDNIDKRVAEVRKYFKSLTYEATIQPSFIDNLVHWLNPVNKNHVCYIYKLN